MSDAGALKAQVEKIRQQTQRIFEDIAQKTSRFKLPTLPKMVEEYQQKLLTSHYKVLVVGEAKRGKSSFINALIGRELLPTDVEIATNQVFHIAQATQDAFRLRFEDETTQTINAAELIEYGSQAVADQRGAGRLNLDFLRWIEVDIPIRFLPPDVNILDTPGLGSLYAAHAQITQRFVPQADAVIFVLDSNQPISQFELEFVEKILDVTNHIFFIQTKIDLYDKEDWQRVQQRHEEILQGRFKDRPIDMHVWPISSRNLLKAAQASNPTGYLKVSRQQELSEALEAFLFKVAGWNRCADALQIADHYYTTSRQSLAGRLAGLEAKNTQELIKLQQISDQKSQQLNAEWGTSGKERRTLLSKLKNSANANKSMIMSFIQASGDLEMTYRNKIDAIKSIEEANKLGAQVSEEVVIAANTQWRTACEQFRHQCSVLLGSLIEATDILASPPEAPELPAHIGPALDIKNNVWDKFNMAQEDFISGTNVGFAVAVIASVFIPITVPVALIGIAMAGIWGAARGWKEVNEAQLKDAQQQLHDQLSAIIQEISKRFLQPNIRYEGQSLVNYYFDSQVHQLEDQMEEIVAAKVAGIQQESARLNQQANMDKEQRAWQLEEYRKQLAEWDELGRSIRTTIAELKRLEP